MKRLWAYLKRYSKRYVFSYKIRMEETSIELLERILDDNNIFDHYKQVYRNKGTSGIANLSVEELGHYIFLHKEAIK